MPRITKENPITNYVNQCELNRIQNGIRNDGERGVKLGRRAMKKTYALFWSPEGRKIAIVTASGFSEARRKAPKPYRKYLGEIGVELLAVQDFSVNRIPSWERTE